MGNPNTLQPNVFSSENQPATKGRKKGVPNRATVLKKFLAMKTDIDDPRDAAKKLNITLYEAAALGQIAAAADGNTAAWRQIQDDLFGKLTERTEITGADGEPIIKQPQAYIVEVISNGQTRPVESLQAGDFSPER